MPTSHDRHALIKRVVTYTLMTLAVLVISTALFFLLLGYRFNRSSGTFVQGGLVQFISQPSGAHITVGSADLANKTRTKITLNPGSYTVKMTLEGYQPWQKRITVKAGTVLWLNTAHFVPQSPKTEPVLTLPNLSSTAAQPGGKYLAYIDDAQKPVITFINVNDSLPAPKNLTLPSTSFTAAKASTFRLADMSSDGRHVLVQHQIGSLSEWLVTDLENANATRQIGGTVAHDVRQVLFDPRSNDRVIYLDKAGTVRSQTLSSGSLSPSLATQVATMSLSPQGTLFYATTPTGGVSEARYLTNGAPTSRLLKSYKTTEPIRLAGNQYFDDFYLATSVGATTTIARYDNFPGSDSAAPLRSTDLKTITTETPISALTSTNDGRLIVLQHGTTVTTYDLELDTQSDTPLAGVSAQSAVVSWLDDYHFFNDASGKLRQYEFDGSNQTDIAAVAPGFAALYTGNQKYLYSIGKTKTGYVIQRTQMIID